MQTAKIALVLALGALFCTPASVSFAEDNASEPSLHDQVTTEGAQTVGLSSANGWPVSHVPTSSPDASSHEPSNVQSVAPQLESESDHEGLDADLDDTRQALRTKYKDPAAVTLPPKLLVPRSKPSKSSDLQEFDVVQLQNRDVARPLGPGPKQQFMVITDVVAKLNVIPVDFENIRISVKSPAQEFFDGAWVGIAGMASSAVALALLAFIRGKSRNRHSR